MFKKLVAIILPILVIISAKTAFPVNLPIGTLPTLPAPSASPSDSFPAWNSTSGNADKVYLYDLVNLPPFQTEFSYLDPMTTVGDLIYENATPAPARLGGNTSSTKNFLCSTGTGSAANAPSWCTIASGDVPNNAANTTGTAANLAGAYAIPSPSPSSSGEFAESTGSGIIWNSVPVAGITALTGDVTASGSGSVAATLAATTNATLTTLSALASIDSGVAANKFIASPNGSSGAMTPRIIVSADIPTLNQNTTGTAANLAGIYAIPSPGPSGDIMVATGSSWLAQVAPSPLPSPGPSGDVLTATGSSWIASSSAVGTATNIAGGLGGSIPYQTAVNTTALLANGTAGNILQSNGTTLAPSWVAPSATIPGSYYASVYYPGSGSNYWDNANTSIGDFTAHGTIPSPSTFVNSNFGTISKATSSLPGINFTAPRTGTIKITVRGMFQQNSSSVQNTIALIESTTSTTLDNMTFNYSTLSTDNQPQLLLGYFPATASTTYNFKLQSFSSAGTLTINSGVTSSSMLTFSMEYIN